MEFLHVYERPDLKPLAENVYGQVEAVFAQEDTWDVHVFILFRDGDTLTVAMEDVRKDSKTTIPAAEDFEREIDGCAEDEKQADSLKEALELIVGGHRWTFQTPEYTKVLGEAEEAEKLSRMSKYARKKYLQEREG